MSARRAWVITCDDPSGCAQEYASHSGNPAVAWSMAEKNRWRRRKVGLQLIDICPDHRRDTDV